MVFRVTDVPKHLKHRNKHIGYRVLDLFEDCYEWNDFGCFVADTRFSAERFLKSAWGNSTHYRIDRMNFATLMEEYKTHFCEYEMELEAYARFQKVATLNGIPFSSKLDEYDGSLMSVYVGRDNHHDW